MLDAGEGDGGLRQATVCGDNFAEWLEINPATGLISGSFVGKYPAGATTLKAAETKFFGVVFPKQNKAEGMVLGPRHTGRLDVLPQ